MAEKIEDLNLPTAPIQRIIKEVLPSNINLSKDTKSSLARAASVFILYVTSHASQLAQKSNRKTMLGQDIIEALENLEFEELVDPVKTSLDEYKSQVKNKKGSKQKGGDEESMEVEEDEEQEQEDVS
ncbi:DNA polymerase epsilon subunit 3 [Agrilus planipennis]|uniref:DNA polymerase epsilon subunit 3 n=1 Tax=Agrilus planipennis TaxID=224129 RepID=A0A7F5RMI2_AGRPL|nr:DNA polymerase epsilon subunit 3 [Agrilus planipennis]